MTWTTAADLRLQVQKLWDKGDLLRPCVQGVITPPLRLRLTTPSSTVLTERFDDVRVWMKTLGCNAHPIDAPRYRIVMREFRHRVLGSNAVPAEVWLDTLDDTLALIGKQNDAQLFAGLVQSTREQQPVLLPWLEKRPLNALALADVWPRLLAVVACVQAHPRPGIYLRQATVPAVNSKFIEVHRGVLSDLLDLALPAEAVDASASGVSQFARRYGFKDKPLRIRFRVLDATIARLADGPLPAGAELDITLTQADFAAMSLPVKRVFFTENEINFLAFPSVPHSLVVFGAGYGFEVLAGAAWLHKCSIHYWGDIDTHGFAILDQLRAHLPHVQSLLMDRQTLMAHQDHWGEESQPALWELPRLDPAERSLFDDLRHNRLQAGLRLEQERVGFDSLLRALERLQ